MAWDPTGRSGSASNNDGPGTGRSVRESMHQGADMETYRAIKGVLGENITQDGLRQVTVHHVNPGQGVGSTGPGNVRVSRDGALPPRQAVGSGPGNAVVVSGQLKPVMSDEITQFLVGGLTLHPNPGSSDMQEVENRWGDSEFLSPAWFSSWAISGSDAWYTADVKQGGPLRTDNIARDWAAMPGAIGSFLDWAGDVSADRLDETFRSQRAGTVGGRF